MPVLSLMYGFVDVIVDEVDPLEYPYSLEYLQLALKRNSLLGKEILDVVFEMEDWLNENCKENGDSNYKLSTGEKFITTINHDGYIDFILADIIYFKFETDLLAFRLRWGF